MMFTVYGKKNCGYCAKAKNLLERKEVPFRFIDVEEDRVAMRYLRDRNFKSVPQIYNDDNVHIGGYTELAKLFP